MSDKIHEIHKAGNIYYLLNAFLGAYNRRTDAWVKVNNDLLTAISQLDRKVDMFMATQEERLQAIATKIDEVLSDLAALKANNPQIEDEISAIESKLSIAQPTPGDGGDTGTGGTGGTT